MNRSRIASEHSVVCTPHLCAGLRVEGGIDRSRLPAPCSVRAIAHRERLPPNNLKTALPEADGKRVDLRHALCRHRRSLGQVQQQPAGVRLQRVIAALAMMSSIPISARTSPADLEAVTRAIADATRSRRSFISALFETQRSLTRIHSRSSQHVMLVVIFRAQGTGDNSYRGRAASMRYLRHERYWSPHQMVEADAQPPGCA